jgi:hypothetical protein
MGAKGIKIRTKQSPRAQGKIRIKKKKNKGSYALTLEVVKE